MCLSEIAKSQSCEIEMKKICLAIVAIGTFIAGLLPNTASAAYTSEQAFSRMR